jgi:hypothetical protein
MLIYDSDMGNGSAGAGEQTEMPRRKQMGQAPLASEKHMENGLGQKGTDNRAGNLQGKVNIGGTGAILHKYHLWIFFECFT